VVNSAGTSRQDGAGGLQAVLFDMDGLLIDSEPLWFQAEAEVMAKLGGTWAEGDQKALLGGSLDRSVSYLLKRAERPVPPDTVAAWLLGGITARVRDHGVSVMPGARELVAEVAAAGVPYALVTSSQRCFVDAVLRRTGLRFPVIVCAEDPSRAAARRPGADPARCVALEDSATGVASAEAAGCRVVAVPSLAPIEPRPGRAVARSLLGIDLAWLRALCEQVTAG
jgi:HAD superfamily hydrolase (TIGR01509 family)